MNSFKIKKALKLSALLVIFVLLLACRNQTIRVNKTLFGLSENWKVVYEIEGKVKSNKGAQMDEVFTVGENTRLTLEFTGNPEDLESTGDIWVKRLFAGDINLSINNQEQEHDKFVFEEKPNADILMMFEMNDGYIISVEWGLGIQRKEFIVMH